MNKQWVTAYYHMPLTYSCRVPMTSISSAKALPAPSPATVLLALIRTALEFYDHAYVRNYIFPILMQCEVRIRPPGRLGISTHHLWGNKPTNKGRHVTSLIYREFVHTDDFLVISLGTMTNAFELLKELLHQIPYWGQTDSLAICVDVREEELLMDYGVTLDKLPEADSISAHYSSWVTMIKPERKTWKSIVEGKGLGSPFAIELYTWPLRIIEQQSTTTILERHSLEVHDDILGGYADYNCK